MNRIRLYVPVVAMLVFAWPATAFSQDARTATLRLAVMDQSGAVIPGAVVDVKGIDSPTTVNVLTDGQGVATAAALPPGHYRIEASFPGFERLVMPDVRLRAGENKRQVTLAIQKLDENVSVGRDPATSAADPNNDRFATTLSKQQIEALPDDPDEMEKVLKEMAGPGASIRVDGFRGGKLPPKAQIRSIRFSRDMFAAENHGGGMVFVDIATQPGIGPLTGSLDFSFRDDALNARNAFQPVKGPEQTQQYTLNLSGTLLKNRTSFSLSAGGASLYDSANVFAATPGGARTQPVRRPSDRVNFNGRIDHALSRSHTLRATYQQNADEQRNLGVGSFDLAERAFARSSDDSVLRLSESGPWSRTVFGESRLQVRRTADAARSMTELPTVRVLDAFTSGGAQQAGGRSSTEIEWATTIDWARGKHSIRTGTLVEGGRYRGDSRTNYLGSYTFTSLADFERGRPATYTRRVGDPFVSYSFWQAGVYVQDDWRARKNLTISTGLRQELQTHLDDGMNLAPRAGFTWSPFKSGRTTVRGGGGLFYDWLDRDVFEQTLRVDGVRQQDIVIRNPGYPDPYAGGSDQQVLPASKYMLGPGLTMPLRALVTFGVSQQLSTTLTVNVSFNHAQGANRLRGRNLNAPLDGVRPDPSLGNVTEVESTGSVRNDMASAGLVMNLPAKRTMVFVNYMWMRQRNDSDGAFSLPASSYDLASEWGPASGISRHNVSGMISTSLPRNVRVGMSATARSGAPYNITTGRDDNEDTVFNDRPAGMRRNRAIGPGMWDVAARVSYAFGFGERPASAPGGGQVVIVHRTSGGGAGDLLGAFGGGGADNKRLRVELFASASNLFNHVNPIGISGVMTSPFFGQPTAAMPGRRVDVGMRVGF